MSSKHWSPKTSFCHLCGIFQWCVIELQPQTWLWTKPKASRAWARSFLKDPVLPYVYQRYPNCLCNTQSAMDFAAAVNSAHSSQAQDNWSAPSAAGPLLSTVILVSVTYWRRAWTCSEWKINGRIPVGSSGSSPNPFSTAQHPSPLGGGECRHSSASPARMDGSANGSHKACWSTDPHQSRARAEELGLIWRKKWCQLT